MNFKVLTRGMSFGELQDCYRECFWVNLRALLPGKCHFGEPEGLSWGKLAHKSDLAKPAEFHPPRACSLTLPSLTFRASLTEPRGTWTSPSSFRTWSKCTRLETATSQRPTSPASTLSLPSSSSSWSLWGWPRSWWSAVCSKRRQLGGKASSSSRNTDSCVVPVPCNFLCHCVYICVGVCVCNWDENYWDSVFCLGSEILYRVPVGF